MPERLPHKTDSIFITFCLRVSLTEILSDCSPRMFHCDQFLVGRLLDWIRYMNNENDELEEREIIKNCFADYSVKGVVSGKNTQHLVLLSLCLGCLGPFCALFGAF